MSDQTIKGVPAEVIRREVARLEAEHGLCHPLMLVQAAQAKASPLHPLFTWDDTEAAAQWRVHEARRVINTIRVVIDNVEHATPAYLHVTRVADDGTRQDGYATTFAALTGPDRSGVLADALAQLRGMRRRYGVLTELSKVWSALDAIDAPESDEAAAA